MVRIVNDAANRAEDSSPDRKGKQNGAQAGYTRRQQTPLLNFQQSVGNGT